MATITYRRIDQSISPTTGVMAYEPVFGGGQADFISDIDAVGQAAMTRLRLLQGEWWENLNDGLPLFQQILGQAKGNDQQAINLLIQQRILGTPFVSGIISLQSSYDPNSRTFTFYSVIQTQFGPVSVSNSTSNFPTPPKQGV